LSKTSFAWYTLHDKEIDKYRSNLSESIFSAIELCHQPYDAIMNMPVKRLYDLLKWKSDLEEEKAKIMKEKQSKVSSKR
jgi:hypothetical protein